MLFEAVQVTYMYMYPSSFHLLQRTCEQHEQEVGGLREEMAGRVREEKEREAQWQTAISQLKQVSIHTSQHEALPPTLDN